MKIQAEYTTDTDVPTDEYRREQTYWCMSDGFLFTVIEIYEPSHLDEFEMQILNHDDSSVELVSGEFWLPDNPDIVPVEFTYYK